MSQSLQGKKIAILVADGFEQVEMTEPKQALIDAGAAVQIVSPNSESVQAHQHDKRANTYEVDVPLDSSDPADFDALVLPGGVMNPDRLRQNPRAIAFIRAFAEAGKPIAAICHGPWSLIEADLVRGRRITSYPSLRTDLLNAGAKWVDEQVVVDEGLVTSRNPDDLPAFCEKMIEVFAQGRHAPTVGHGVEDQPWSGWRMTQGS